MRISYWIFKSDFLSDNITSSSFRLLEPVNSTVSSRMSKSGALNQEVSVSLPKTLTSYHSNIFLN